MHEPTVATETRDKIAACGIDITVIGWQIFASPKIDGFRERTMAIGEERPVEEALVRH
jgi:hypothetical protein